MAGNFFTAVRRGMCVALLAGSLGACAGGLGGNKEVPLDELPPEEIYKRGELTLETARKPGDSLRYFAMGRPKTDSWGGKLDYSNFDKGARW